MCRDAICLQSLPNSLGRLGQAPQIPNIGARQADALRDIVGLEAVLGLKPVHDMRQLHGRQVLADVGRQRDQVAFKCFGVNDYRLDGRMPNVLQRGDPPMAIKWNIMLPACRVRLGEKYGQPLAVAMPRGSALLLTRGSIFLTPHSPTFPTVFRKSSPMICPGRDAIFMVHRTRIAWPRESLQVTGLVKGDDSGP